MGKGKRNKSRRSVWADDRLATASADVAAAERRLLEARKRAAIAAAQTNGHRPPASPEEQAEAFFNRPGDYYIAKFEVTEPKSENVVRAECVLKADEVQRDYLVEVMRQIRGAFGEHARISLARAQTQQQRVVDAPRFDMDEALERADRTRQAAAEAVRRRNEQMLTSSHLPSHVDGLAIELDQMMPDEPPDLPREQLAEVCKAHRDAACKRCDDTVDDLWIHPRDLTREQLQEQLPGMTRAETAAELGVDPADLGGDIKHVPPDVSIEQLAAELGVSPLDLQPIDMSGGGRVYAVKRPAPPTPGRHAAPDQGGDT